jgi:uncharacterized protein (TIGR03435 family)
MVKRPITAVVLMVMAVTGAANNAALPAQQRDVRATFDVTSVKVNRSGEAGFRGGTKGSTYSAVNIPLRYVIAAAHAIPVARVLGGPSWIGEAGVDLRFTGGERFDITGTLPAGAVASQVPAMLRAMLADRFKLQAHTEMREAPMYALVLARSDGRLGPQLRSAPIDCDATQAAGQPVPAARPGERGLCASEIGGEIIGRGQTAAALAGMLSLFAGRPVVDRTGLPGGYDFDLRFPELNTPVGGRSGDPGADSGGGVFVAVQEQLGLKLDAIRGPLAFVVIDSVDRPTEN